MNPIRTNKPVFFADDGEPLASGYIYVGLPGQDPRNFPKTVTFEDSGGGQFTAAQPLRTNGQGQISYNGKAIIALVEGDYSLLIEDRTGTQTKSGWTPTVSNSASGGGSTIGTQVGLLLEDIKLFDVSPGDTVRNIGKDTALDSLGADWLVVSSTGAPADDVDLIDFDNGTQGERIKSVVYSRGLVVLDNPIEILNTSNTVAYRNTWVNVDISSQVPATATFATLRVFLTATYPSSGISNSIVATAYARKTGTGAGATNSKAVAGGSETTNTNAALQARAIGEFTVKMPDSGASSFEIYSAISPSSDLFLSVSVVGYTISAKGIV